MAIRTMEENDKFPVAGSALGALGSSAVALLTSLCCVGPGIVALLGAGGAVAAANLEPYRPYFLGASFAMLGYGFWRSYWPRRTATGAACRISTGRRVRAMLWVSLTVTALSAVIPFWI